MPKNLAKERVHVDGGSPVFNEVVRQVPVLPHKSHALVSRDIRATSLSSMVGVDVAEAEAKDPDHQNLPLDTADAATAATDAATAEAEKADAAKALVSAALKKRRLYRQRTGTEVPWFPNGNDIELLKE